jgi:penicillin-binding protein 1A
VVDGRGQVRANLLETARTRVIPAKCIPPTRAVLNEVVRSGTGRGARLQRWAAYGKTGTSTANADAWFIGWTEGRVLGIWMGKRRDAVGPAIAGAGAPADLFRLVSNSANEIADYRAGRERHEAKTATAERKPMAPRNIATPERKVAEAKEAVRARPPSREPPQNRLKWEPPSRPPFDHELWSDEEDEFVEPWRW